jgi:carboxylesterase
VDLSPGEPVRIRRTLNSLNMGQKMVLSNQPFLLRGSRSRACLLLHGLGGGIYELQYLGEYLHDLGWTVQGILYPGHDAPARKMPASTWPQWYGHILEAYQQLAREYAEIALVGFSTGCPLALQLATNYPVHRLVMLSPYLFLRHYWYYGLPLEAYVWSLGYVIPDLPRLRLPIFDLDKHKMAWKVSFFQTFNLAAVRSAINLIDLVKPKLSEIDVPTLIIQSLKDTIVAPSGAQYLYDRLGSIDKHLRWLENSDHVISMDSEREMVFHEVGEFLSLKPFNPLPHP